MNTRILLIGLTLITAFSMPLHAQQEQGVPDPSNGLSITYNIYIPDTTRDDWDIIHMNLDGSGKCNVIHHPDVAWTYEAYGDRLLFISDRDTSYRFFRLYECDREGKQLRRISDLRLEDSWMSARNDGREVVVSGRVGKAVRYQLFIISINTGTFRQITSDTAAMFRDPCFSPDGKKIVVNYKANRRDKSSHEELFLMNADGSGLQQLTRYPDGNPSAAEHGYKAGAPRWHPTENFIPTGFFKARISDINITKTSQVNYVPEKGTFHPAAQASFPNLDTGRATCDHYR